MSTLPDFQEFIILSYIIVEDLKKALSLAPKNKEVNLLLLKVKEQRKKSLDKEKNMFKGIFNSAPVSTETQAEKVEKEVEDSGQWIYDQDD